MKKYLPLILILLFSLQLSAQGINFFHGSWEEALAEAKKSDKILFVDAYAQWCGPCKRMARDVFTKPKVGDFFNDNFINLKLDMETPDGYSFGKKYPVSAFPTLLFLDVEGNILKKVVGGQSDVGLIELGASAIKSYDRSDDYAAQYEAGERNFDLMYSYVAALNQVDKPSLKIANEYWKSDHGMNAEQSALFLMEAVQEADSRLFDALVEHRKDAIKATSAEAYEEIVEKAALNTIHKAVEFDFKELLDEAIAKYDAADAGDNDRFKSFAYLEYYKLRGNYNEWKSESQNVLKKFGKKDYSLYNMQIQTLRNEFKYHNDALDYATDIARELVKKDDKGDNSFLYLQLLLANKQFDEAQKHLPIALKNAKSRKEDTSRFERIQTYLDSI
jgi:thiol-disulfide isomerase/thioredoxin